MQMQLLNDMISIYFARSRKKYMNGTFNTYKQVVQSVGLATGLSLLSSASLKKRHEAP
jgi:hypothetical protein